MSAQPIPKDREISVKVHAWAAYSRHFKFEYNVKWCPRRRVFVARDGTMFGERYIDSWDEPTDRNRWSMIGYGGRQ